MAAAAEARISFTQPEPESVPNGLMRFLHTGQDESHISHPEVGLTDKLTADLLDAVPEDVTSAIAAPEIPFANMSASEADRKPIVDMSNGSGIFVHAREAFARRRTEALATLSGLALLAGGVALSAGTAAASTHPKKKLAIAQRVMTGVERIENYYTAQSPQYYQATINPNRAVMTPDGYQFGGNCRPFSLGLPIARSISETRKQHVVTMCPVEGGGKSYQINSPLNPPNFYQGRVDKMGRLVYNSVAGRFKKGTIAKLGHTAKVATNGSTWVDVTYDGLPPSTNPNQPPASSSTVIQPTGYFLHIQAGKRPTLKPIHV